MTAGRRDLHMRLGLASLGLAPAILVLFTAVTIVRYYDITEAGLGALAANILFLQIRVIVMFPVFVIWALAVRVRDPETHKRAMILAALLPIGAAFGRMAWIPGNDLMVTFDVSAIWKSRCWRRRWSTTRCGTDASIALTGSAWR